MVGVCTMQRGWALMISVPPFEFLISRGVFDICLLGIDDPKYCVEFTLSQEEKLDGDNQYFCTNCGTKQNAERRIELHTLPPVLNLQLLRFVFDR